MTEITLGLEWFLNPDHIPFVVADERGYYENEGLKLDIWEPPEHYDTLEMLAEGELDFAITEPIHLVPERSEGIPVTGIAKFLHTRGGIQYPTDRGWDSPADLDSGVRLNYPGAPGLAGRKMVAHMIQHAGGDLTAEDIEPVDRGFYHTDALLDGDADIAFLAFYNFEIIESRHRNVSTDLWELAEYGVPDFNQLVLTTSDLKVDTAPGQIQRFIDATRRGIEDTVDDPERAIELFFDRYPEVAADDPALMHKIAMATIEFFTPELSQDTAMYHDLVQFCDDLDLSAGPVSVEEFTTDRFSQ